MLEKSIFIEMYQVKARANLSEASECLKSQQPRAAISRAYYALYQAANAWIAHSDNGAAFDPGRPNVGHDEVDDLWPGILEEIQLRSGIECDFDGERIFGTLKGLRVRVDYKSGPAPTMSDAESAVSASTRAVTWLLAALKKVGS